MYATPDRIRALLAVGITSALFAVSAAAEIAGGAVVGPTPAVQVPAAAAPRVSAPLAFESNVGQSDPAAEFVARGSSQTAFLARDHIALATRSGSFRLQFEGASRDVRVVGADRLRGVVNHYEGPSSSWVAGAPTFARVVYEGLYPGIDAAFYGVGSQIEYDFYVSPGADPTDIVLRVDGGRVAIDQGALVVTGPAGVWRQDAPRTFQDTATGRRVVPSRFSVTGRYVRIEVGAYDRSQVLTIDPTWEFGTVFGGSGIETGQGLAVDNRGYIYVGGETWGLDYPTTPGAYQTEPRDAQDAFVIKLDPTGRHVIYSTYLGGVGWDAIHRQSGLAVDQDGAAYVGGWAWGSTFPTTEGAYDRQWDGPQDTIIAKLDPTGGQLVYSTFLGGRGGSLDGLRALAVDTHGNVYATGVTTTADFPTRNPLDAELTGLFDGWIAKLNAAGSDLLFSTYYGGAERAKEDGQSIALAPDGTLYHALMTDATDVRATVGSPDNPGRRSILVSAIDTKRAELLWSRWIGGDADESDVTLQSAAVAVDPGGAVYVATPTLSSGLATTPGAAQATKAAGADTFATKLSPDGQEVVYATYLGGSMDDRNNHAVVDPAGALHVVGRTWSPDLFDEHEIVTGLSSRGGADGFAYKLTPDGTALVYGAYLGGPGEADSAVLDGATAMLPLFFANEETAVVAALDHRGDLYVTGVATSESFPTTDGSTPNGPWDAYVVKIRD